MNSKLVITLFLVGVIGVSGCTSTNNSETDQQTQGDGGNNLVQFANNYYRYDPDAYKQALSEDKAVFLFFTANWCPLCAAQRPKILAAFNEISYDDVIGFEVHYNDWETQNFDIEIAQKFQVPYQDTKIIIDKNNNVLVKTQSHLEKEMIISEIERARLL